MAGCVLCKGSYVVGLVLRQKDEIGQNYMLKKKLNYKQYTTGRCHLKKLPSYHSFTQICTISAECNTPPQDTTKLVTKILFAL